MAYEIVMPQLGLTMTEGSVNTWIKHPGERVQKGEMLFTVSTDKVDMEVESTASGFLNTVVDVGQTVAVGTVIAVLTDRPDESVNTTPQPLDDGDVLALTAPLQPLPTSEPSSTSEPHADSAAPPGPPSFPASPRARSLAKNLGIDLTGVAPASGNRIVEADIKRHAEAQKSEAQKPEAQKSAVPMSATRRITAERTTQSFERAPHFYLGREVNAGRLVQLRKEIEATAQRKLGFNLTYTDFLLRALAMALLEQTAVNATWQDGAVVPRSSLEVAFAAQTEKGLLVPVIHNAGQLDLFGIAKQRKDLSERAKSGKLQGEDLQGGSATLSNLGAHGVDWFQAILNPPQSAILAAGRIAQRPTVIDGRLEVADTLVLCLSADHRVLDGVAAATFLSAIVRVIEKPLELLV